MLSCDSKRETISVLFFMGKREPIGALEPLEDHCGCGGVSFVIPVANPGRCIVETDEEFRTFFRQLLHLGGQRQQRYIELFTDQLQSTVNRTSHRYATASQWHHAGSDRARLEQESAQ